MKKVPLAGGRPVTISDAANSFGASWGRGDQIVFAMDGRLLRVGAAGGQPEAVTTLAEGEAFHASPHILPGGNAALFTVLSKSGAPEDARIEAVSLTSGERRVLMTGGASGRYSPTGHLLYTRGSDMFAVAFDLADQSVSGTPFLAVRDIRVIPHSLHGEWDISAEGTLAYLPGGGAELQRTFVWTDRRGGVRSAPVPPRPYMHPNLLPDGRGVIVEIEETPHNIWHCDLVTGALTRLTHEGANHRAVVSPDGRMMAFSSDRTSPRSLFLQATDGGGAAEPLFNSAHALNVTSWSRDGRWLAFTEANSTTKGDIWVVAMEGDRRAMPVVQTRFAEDSGAFSPDGRWLAYSSDESGRREVMIRAFPGSGPRKQVSTAGGEVPVFSHDGTMLYYRLGSRVLAARIVTAPELSIGVPDVAFELPSPHRFSGLPNFAINPSGDALLAVKVVESTDWLSTLNVIVNWFEALRNATDAR
jgi:hypothetical protein